MPNVPIQAAGKAARGTPPRAGGSLRRFDPRQAMNRPDYEIFHYHDRRMQEVPLHHHDFYEIYYFLHGRVEYLVEGRTYTLLPDDVLLISPMELHRPLVAPEADYERMVLWISRDCLQADSAENAPLLRCFSGGRNLYHAGRTPVGTLFRTLAEETESAEPASGLCARGVFLQLLGEVCRLVLTSAQAAEARQEVPLVTQVLDYITEHYAETLSLDALAERFFVSKYYLSHQFSETVGTSIHRYMILKRLQQARELITEGSSPGEACMRCGFQDYANFYRAFRSVYGMNPNECRGVQGV